MWSIIQQHPYLFALGIVIFLTLAASVVYGIVRKGNRKDRGLLKGNGHDLKWPVEAFPLPVWFRVDQLSPTWLYNWERAAQYLSDVAGRPLFLAPLQALDQLQLDRISGVVLQDDAGMDPFHGRTDLRWDKRTGHLMSAVVTFPQLDLERAIVARPVALHEACHVLGLDHDDQVKSIMHPVLQKRPQNLSRADKTLIRKLYGRKDV